MRKLTVLSLLLSLFAAVSGFCADQKFAVVDMEKLFQSYYKTKIADADINLNVVHQGIGRLGTNLMSVGRVMRIVAGCTGNRNVFLPMRK